MQLQCPVCGGEFVTYPSRIKRGEGKYCSWACHQKAYDHTKAKGWKRRRVRTDGYVSVRIDGREVLEHRYVMEQYIGRALSTDEQVHHINGNKQDNRPDNLQLLSVVDHALLHAELARQARG